MITIVFLCFYGDIHVLLFSGRKAERQRRQMAQLTFYLKSKMLYTVDYELQLRCCACTMYPPFLFSLLPTFFLVHLRSVLLSFVPRVKVSVACPYNLVLA
jgi:hypothetical protein